MIHQFRGPVWTFGDDISTDHIISGKYLGTTDSKAFAAHAFEAVDPTGANKEKAGDLIEARDNLRGAAPLQSPLRARQTLAPHHILPDPYHPAFLPHRRNLARAL